MKIPKLSMRERRIVLLGGGGLGFLLLVFYGLLPFIEAKGKMKDQIQAKKQILLKNLEIIADKEDYLRDRELLIKKLEQTKTKLLNETNASVAGQHLQQTLREMATQSGVEVNRIAPQREEKLGEEYQKVPVNIEIQCLPDQFVQFLLKVRNYDRRLWIDQINVYTSYSRSSKEKDLRIRPSLIISGIIRHVPEKKEETERKIPLEVPKV